MRYLVAMIFAVAGAALAFFFVSNELATWVTGLLASSGSVTVESPDDDGSVREPLFMLFNLAGLLIGWLIGWVIAGPLASSERPS